MDAFVRATDRGVLFRVKAVPGASRDRVVGMLGDAVKVAVTVAAEKGKANDAILSVLADALEVPPRALRIATGQTARLKTVELEGVDRDGFLRRLAAALA